MKRMIAVALGGVLCLALFSACAPSRLDLDFGTSFKLQKFNQAANPEAGKKPEAAEGMDGKAAQGAVEKYQKSFEKEPAAPTYTLSIGGAGSGK